MKVIGLMSGTSADGIDAALVEIQGGDPIPSPTLLAFEIFPYPPGLRERLLDLARAGQAQVQAVCHLDFLLGELNAQAVLALLERAGVAPDEVALVGVHGQTICHLPRPIRDGAFEVRSTLQIGEPAVIAERTGITTVADFRPRDIAAGGEGAPLAPYLHSLLLRDPVRGRAFLNLGGISNLTYVPAGGRPEEVLAFDCGPGNVLIDGIVRRLTEGKRWQDDGGAWAARGAVAGALLTWLLGHPFFATPPPKSAGQGEFGPDLLRRPEAATLGEADLVATVTRVTVEGVAGAIEHFIRPRGRLDEIVVGGGGTANAWLMGALRERLGEIALVPVEELGYPARAVEASAFALLAYLTARGLPGNLPGATGAKAATCLGVIVPGRRFAGVVG
ncbi:MAG: anhydro-N-acetylmuramic acid kinase [Candidatus Methylomirabilales bacterium]